jgi:hypothetical protein
MSPAHVRRWAGVLAAAFTAACSESTAPGVPVSNDPGYAMSLTGDVKTTVQGVPTALRVANGYRETDQSGAESPWTPVVLIQRSAAGVLCVRDATRLERKQLVPAPVIPLQ